MDGSSRDAVEALVCNRELEGWRVICQLHPQQYPLLDFQIHLAPAFRYGLHARHAWRDSVWNADLEDELEQEWNQHRASSVLPWIRARALVRHGFEGFRGPRPAPVRARPTARQRNRASGLIAWLMRWNAQARRIGTVG